MQMMTEPVDVFGPQVETAHELISRIMGHVCDLEQLPELANWNTVAEMGRLIDSLKTICDRYGLG